MSYAADARLDSDDTPVEKPLSVVIPCCESHILMQVLRNNLVNRARKIDPSAIVAQRLKRFSSIASKLVREPRMKLSQMQDIGGCHAIVSTVERAEDLVRAHKDKEAWDKNPNRHELHRCKDYIAEPKPSGY